MDLVALANLTLQTIGTRTTVTQAELNANSTNEAIQFNLAALQTRDELLRMAPWDCCSGDAILQYITSLPGTNENQSTPANQLQWSPGLPLPPWTYEYQYPVDCLRALSIVSTLSTGLQGTPIYPTSTMTGYASYGLGPPIRFSVGNDQFYSVTAAAVQQHGQGHAVGDLITLALGDVSLPPIGAPAVLQVTGISAGGAITTVVPVNSIIGASPAVSGAYFQPQPNPQAQGSTTGSGTNATFNLTYGPKGNQRVILTNQEYAVLRYCRQITDPNVMDALFQKAWYHVIGAKMVMALTGDKGLANSLIGVTNGAIAEARAVDGNEALTVNDVTPDFIRVRGITHSDYWNAGTSYDWGTTGWSTY